MGKPRKEIEKIDTYKHGKSIKELQRELGISEVLKLASNENPLGISPRARAAFLKCVDELHLYPEVASYELVKKLSQVTGFPTEQIITGAGATELIEMLALTYLDPKSEMLTADITFIMYRISTTMMGAKNVLVPLKDYRYDMEAMARVVSDRTKIVFIANPNNPTGTIIHKKELDEFLDKVSDEVIVVMDEAYFDFVDDDEYPDALDYIRSGKNMVCLRTFSKNYGMAGLRVGYAIAPKEIIEQLYKVKKPFNVSRASQAAAIAALDDEEFLRRSVELTHQEKEFLYQEYERLGLKHVPTQTNFIILDMADGDRANNLSQELLKKGVIARPMAGAWGAPHMMRISIGEHNQNVTLIRTLEGIL